MCSLVGGAEQPDHPHGLEDRLKGPCRKSDPSLRRRFPHRSLTENGVPPSGNTRAVVSQSVAGRAPGVVGSKWRE